MSEQTIEERVGRVERQLAYQDLCSRYVHGVDKLEREPFLDCWIEDGQWNLGDEWGNHHGKDAIAAAWELLDGAFHEMHHLTANFQVLEDAEDRVVGRCDAVVPGTDGAGLGNVACASYVDTMVRGEDGAWRFAKRDITVHYLVPWTEPQSLDPDSRRYEMAPATAQG